LPTTKQVVRIAGYDLPEKVAIAEQYLIPKALREAGLVLPAASSSSSSSAAAVGSKATKHPAVPLSVSELAAAEARTRAALANARAAKAHASKQVGGQYSYPNPNIFMKGAGSPVVYRRVLDLSRKVTEAIKWEKKTRKTLHA